jgi:outer membrane biosynthesis protein TonB
MPTTHEIPPNPVETEAAEQGKAAEPAAAGPAKVRTGRFGELEEHELIHLLDTLDDERSRARFRESVYISLFVYIALGWFLFYGPQVIFHQPRLINPADRMREREKELTYLDLPPDVAKELAHRPTSKIADTPHTAQTVKPSLDKKTLESLQAMRRTPAPTPLPPTPQPQQQVASAQPSAPPAPAPLPQQRPMPQAPTPSIDAPRPQPRANFGNQQSAGSAIQQASRGAFQPGGNSGADYDHTQGSHGGLNTGVDVLSDTEGVDFGPYLNKILREIKATWLPLIPEEARPPLNKQGVTQIRFSILPDGRIGGMKLEGSTHDDALNRAAWGSITGIGQFPPLPADFKGPNLELRIHYLVNKTSE